MESQSHFSKRLHDRFLERFKGKIACIDKEGHIEYTRKSLVPIEKVPYKCTNTNFSKPPSNQPNDSSEVNTSKVSPFVIQAPCVNSKSILQIIINRKRWHYSIITQIC